jgi:hypothetical protein
MSGVMLLLMTVPGNCGSNKLSVRMLYECTSHFRHLHRLFYKFKMKLKGLHLADVAEIQEVVTDE